MADLETHIVRAWSEDDPPEPGEAPLLLLRREADGTLSEVARHGVGVSADPMFRLGGEEHDLTTLLDQSRLARDDLMVAAGQELFRRLALGEVGTALEGLSLGTRVVLDLRSDALMPLPWELLRLEEDRLFLDDRQPWYLGTAEPAEKPPRGEGQVPLSLPLRLLLVVGNDPNDPAVKGDDELRTLEDCVHDQRTVLLEILERPSPATLEATLESFEPHIFHFIGHGRVSRGQAVLDIFNRRGVSESWNADRIRQLFRKVRVPRLVVLNACQTGAATSASLWSLTKTFLDLGVGALLTMQAEIRGSVAVDLSRHLYSALVAGRPLDLATTEARSKVAFEGEALARANWPIPRLTLRGDPQDVVRVTAPSDGRCSAAAEKDFVHRWAQRNQICQQLHPLDQGQRLVVLEGPRASGKSELLKILGETWAKVGHSALYVDLGGAMSSNLERLVTRTREEAERVGLDSSPLATIVAEAQDNAQLARKFRAALAALSPNPLMLLFDGFEAWEVNTVTELVIQQILVPYSVPQSSATVWVVAALPEEISRSYAWESLPNPVEPLRVEEFSRHEWRRAAAQFIRWHQGQMAEGMREIFGHQARVMAFLDPPDTPLAPTKVPPNFLQAIRIISSGLRQS